jgi:hypothetical protein
MAMVRDRVQWIVEQPKKVSNVVILTTKSDTQDTMKGLFSYKVEKTSDIGYIQIRGVKYWVSLLCSDKPNFEYQSYLCVSSISKEEEKHLKRWL